MTPATNTHSHTLSTLVIFSVAQVHMSRATSDWGFVLLIGRTGSGKSTFVNGYFDRCSVAKVGYASLFSETHQIEEYSLGNCTLVDTPGFDDTNSNDSNWGMSDADIMAKIISWVMESARKSGAEKCAVLYLEDEDSPGADSARRIFDYLQKRFKDETKKSAIIRLRTPGKAKTGSGVEPKPKDSRKILKELNKNAFKIQRSSVSGNFCHHVVECALGGSQLELGELLSVLQDASNGGVIKARPKPKPKKSKCTIM
ncbi:hypothetical protein FA15DRAFT_61623 [Coprinopsis marcescibilis]|uniref:G domain-containing protein n=1 Tax=Coprinopsis marcescibilis TaxID=230819 RepID=A0A5C3L733_COPMA|nr:hypothetical protein FA15DRAFT_61623 [Coprinopsis marcescibilis]